MKALILAAGLGTRLLPYTEHTPKPLFPIAGQPLLDRIIFSLKYAGCTEIIINTHHLHHQIESFISNHHYQIPVYTRYEPVILGTGGAIKNASDFWEDQPFWVINSDIVTDIDLRKVYEFHLSHNYPATMVLCDNAEFNAVSVDKDGFITDFDKAACGFSTKLSFTGIQVLNPEILNYIPAGVCSSSIDAYRQMIAAGRKIKAYISIHKQWTDVGTPKRYKKIAAEKMILKAFQSFCPECQEQQIVCTKLKGDGSDRAWYRLTACEHSLIMADHGIRKHKVTSEVDSFVNIGRHLYDKGIPVPTIYLYDTFSGLVILEDIGDIHLQTLIQNVKTPEKIISCYKSVIEILIQLSISGANGFNPLWTYQTESYNRQVILEKECRYFVDAFLKGYIGMEVCFEDFEDEFNVLADKAIEFAVNGFMHRDFQSRNIMVKTEKSSLYKERLERFYVIDFQGGRIGPIQYDLASLLIDPYVNLPDFIQSRLLTFCFERLSSYINIDADRFRTGYQYCCITRNLQILGAYGYLSRVKGKTDFETYIPTAVNSLRHTLFMFTNLKKLKKAMFQL